MSHTNSHIHNDHTIITIIIIMISIIITIIITANLVPCFNGHRQGKTPGCSKGMI